VEGILLMNPKSLFWYTYVWPTGEPGRVPACVNEEDRQMLLINVDLR
jgi:hypothetical protein